jgi:arylformamidase
MTVWPGDPAFGFSPEARIASGAICNTSRITMSSHTGTHVDAPWHFEPNGKKVHELDPALFFGEALLIDAGGISIVHAADLGSEKLPRRLLIKSLNSRRPHDAPFTEAFVAVAPDAAQRMVDEGVRMIGVDYLSVAPFHDSETPHHILLQHDVFVVEGLRLDQIPPGRCEFVVLPLLLEGADGAPARAFVGLS